MTAPVVASISTDPTRRPARRDAVPCLLHVGDGSLHVRRRDGRPMLQVPLDRVEARPLDGTALALGVDGSLLRVDFRLPGAQAPGLAGLPRRALRLAAEARARARRGLLLRALR